MWHLEEDYRVYCTLVQGKDLAILWDTGQGKQDLAAYLAERVRTPYLVCNSHGHADHIGGNFRFSGVYAHPADWPLLEAHARMTGRDWHAAPLEAGMSADLGGRRVKVVSLAGHTRGSVGLLLEDEGLLLAGDGLNPTHAGTGSCLLCPAENDAGSGGAVSLRALSGQPCTQAHCQGAGGHPSAAFGSDPMGRTLPSGTVWA